MKNYLLNKKSKNIKTHEDTDMYYAMYSQKYSFCASLYFLFFTRYAMASSVIYYSTEAQKNEIYLFYIIINLVGKNHAKTREIN